MLFGALNKAPRCHFTKHLGHKIASCAEKVALNFSEMAPWLMDGPLVRHIVILRDQGSRMNFVNRLWLHLIFTLTKKPEKIGFLLMLNDMLFL